jgi:glutamyl endopeptidase
MNFMPSRKPLVSAFEEVPGYRPRDAAEPGGISLEGVFGDDDRTAVPDAGEPPWRLNCALRIKARDGQRFVGTGWFIGPRTIITAGHCVFMHEHGGFAESVEVIPALDGAKRPFGSVVSKDVKSVGGWTNKKDADFDYGAILLPDDRFAHLGAFAFAALPPSSLAGVQINISGYPADRDSASKQYFHGRKLLLVQKRRLFYRVDTFGGQSGSAAWITIPTSEAAKIGVPVAAGAQSVRLAVGIHTAGATVSNFATRITSDVAENFRKWL